MMGMKFEVDTDYRVLEKELRRLGPGVRVVRRWLTVTELASVCPLNEL